MNFSSPGVSGHRRRDVHCRWWRIGSQCFAPQDTRSSTVLHQLWNYPILSMHIYSKQKNSKFKMGSHFYLPVNFAFQRQESRVETEELFKIRRPVSQWRMVPFCWQRESAQTVEPAGNHKWQRALHLSLVLFFCTFYPKRRVRICPTQQTSDTLKRTMI